MKEAIEDDKGSNGSRGGSDHREMQPVSDSTSSSMSVPDMSLDLISPTSLKRSTVEFEVIADGLNDELPKQSNPYVNCSVRPSKAAKPSIYNDAFDTPPSPQELFALPAIADLELTSSCCAAEVPK